MDAKPRVLIVDDEDVVRLSYAMILARENCQAQTAWDGDEALRAMGSAAFDVVLLDMRMPGTGGMSVLKSIKEKWPESEVIVITGYPTVESAKEAIRLGAHDYLAKPVGPEEVMQATRSALRSKQWALHSAPGNC
jgi:DNA-binding NtrC family response regulator